MLRTGDLLADFAAGWDLHIEFGVTNPVLYAFMYGPHRDDISQKQAARVLLARMPSPGESFTPAEAALLRQWLAVLATEPDAERIAPASSTPRKGSTAYPAGSTHLLGGEYRVPRIGYGTMRLSGPSVIGLPEDVTGAITILRHAVELGVRFFDTANAYGPRTVNQLIGRAVAPFDDEIVVGNKAGASRGASGEWLTDGRPETIRTQVEGALLDLRTDISPLTYLRLWGDSTDRAGTVAEDVPLEDSLGALVELREAGKVRHIGISGASPAMLERAQRITPIAAVQNRFNILDRSGVGVLSACERDGIAFVPHFPLAAGTLADLDALVAQATGVV